MSRNFALRGLEESAAAPRRKRVFGAVERFFLHASGWGTLVSGAAWLLADRFLRAQGEFGATTHPLTPWLLRIHGAAAILAVFALGLLIPNHVLPYLARGRRRVSGIAVLSFCGALVVSGFLLYYVSGETARLLLSRFHWIAGFVAAGALLLHARLVRDR